MTGSARVKVQRGSPVKTKPLLEIKLGQGFCFNRALEHCLPAGRQGAIFLPMYQKAMSERAWMNGLRCKVPLVGTLQKKKPWALAHGASLDPGLTRGAPLSLTKMTEKVQ